MVQEKKIKVMVKVLLMDHNQKVKDQDHQRAKFPNKMEKDKVKILDLLKVKMEKQIQSQTEKMENQIQIQTVKMEIQSQTAKTENQIQSQTVKMENQIVKIKMESQIQNLMEKMENQIVKIKMENQNLTGKMAKTENQIQNQMAKTENHQNQIVKMVKIQNTIKTMAINPQQDNLLTETVSKKTKVVTLLFRL